MRIAGRDIGFHPGQNGRNLLLGERRIIGKAPKSRVGKPRRHHFGFNRFRDDRRPLPSLLIRHQGHGSDFAGAVTTLAMVLKDGENISVEGGMSGRGLTGGGDESEKKPGEKKDYE